MTSGDAAGERAQHFRIGRGLEGADPELREKLARQLHKLAADVAADAQANQEIMSRKLTSPIMAAVCDPAFAEGAEKPDETDAVPFMGCGVNADDSDDAEVSDADSEPLEYAMLDMVSSLGGEAHGILDKVRRQHEKHQKLKQEMAIVRKSSASWSESPEKSRTSSGCEVASLDPDPSVRRLQVELDATLKDEQEENQGGKEADKHELTDVFEDSVELEAEAEPEAEAEEEEEELEEEAEEVEEEEEEWAEEEEEVEARRCCGGRWTAFWVLIAGLVLAHQGPEAIAQQLLPQFSVAPPPARLGSGGAVAPEGADAEDSDGWASDMEEIEDRLRRSREFKQRRVFFLSGAARVFVGTVGVLSLLCLSMALLCWRNILGAVVAVMAGAVVFVLAVVAADFAELINLRS